jgi:hypothetical protein
MSPLKSELIGQGSLIRLCPLLKPTALSYWVGVWVFLFWGTSGIIYATVRNQTRKLKMSQETASFFELIRREGLIVVALAALVWQVYWLTTTSAAQDKLWREEMAAYRVEAQAEAQRRLQAGADIAQAMTKIVARLDSIEDKVQCQTPND